MKYSELSRKRKQLIASEYPYKSDAQLFDSTLGLSFESRKPFASKKEILDFKEEAAQQDVALQKRRDFVVGENSTANSQTISILDTVCSPIGEEVYRDAIEMAQHELDPSTAIKEMYILQAQRLAQGRKYEIDADLGLSQETEAAISNMINIIKLDNEIKNGKKLDVQLEGSLSSMIMGMDLDEIDLEDEYIDANIIKEDEEDEKDDGD